MVSDFSITKQLFNIPKNMIYLDGNSLGPPTKASAQKVGVLIDEKWAKRSIKIAIKNDDCIGKAGASLLNHLIG